MCAVKKGNGYYKKLHAHIATLVKHMECFVTAHIATLVKRMECFVTAHIATLVKRMECFVTAHIATLVKCMECFVMQKWTFQAIYRCVNELKTLTETHSMCF